MKRPKIWKLCLILALLVASAKAIGAQGRSPAYDDPPHAGQIPLDLKDASDYAQVVYIDPETTTPGDGSSPASPLASWADVSFQADTAYVQKRGTTDQITDAMVISGENVLLGAYGPKSNPRPIILEVSTSIQHMLQIQADDVTVRDLEIVSPQATSGIHFAAGYWPSDGVVWNCSIHGIDRDHYMTWGIRVFGERTKILHSEISYVGDDGVFVQYFPDVEIGYNQITHVNQKWFENPDESYSSGDGVQYDSSDRFYIHHNTVDRSDTGNKFCFIVDPKVDNADGGLIENNVCRVAKDRVPLFAGGATDYRIVIRNNVFEYVDTDGGGIGFYSHASQPELYNNVLAGFDSGIALLNGNAQAMVHHNVFYDIGSGGVWGEVASLEANNNIFALDLDAYVFGLGNVSASHNLFVHASHAVGSSPVLGDPKFVDPADGDFRLQAGSDAIDAGVVVPGIDTDADGNARVGPPDIGAYEFQPQLQLHGSPADRAVHLSWTVNVTLPVTTTWRLDYYTTTLAAPFTATDPLSTTRAYTLTGLTNYQWYTVTLSAVGTTPVLSDTVRVMPTDRLAYLPLVSRQSQ